MSGFSFFKKGKYDPQDPSGFKQFKKAPKSDTTYILYRGDTRSPEMIKQGGGFFPQPGKPSVSESGGSTAMVCLTLDPNVGATYYAYVKQYYKNPTWGTNKPNGFIFACYLPTGRGIMNYQMAEAVGSKNVGSKEISALSISWNHVFGWRQLLSPDECRPPLGKAYHLVDWFADFVANPDFNGNMNLVSRESLETLGEFMGFTNVVIYNNAAL